MEGRARRDAHRLIKRRLNAEQSGEPIPDFMAFYKATMEAAAASVEGLAVGETDVAREMRELIGAVEGEDDEDAVHVAEARGGARRCPILGCALDRPVKNVQCGHVYSLKGAIMFLFQNCARRDARVPKELADVPTGYSASCPVAGCPKYFSATDLKRDFATELTQRQAQSQVRPRDSMDAEDLSFDD